MIWSKRGNARVLCFESIAKFLIGLFIAEVQRGERWRGRRGGVGVASIVTL